MQEEMIGLRASIETLTEVINDLKKDRDNKKKDRTFTIIGLCVTIFLSVFGALLSAVKVNESNKANTSNNTERINKLEQNAVIRYEFASQIENVKEYARLLVSSQINENKSKELEQKNEELNKYVEKNGGRYRGTFRGASLNKSF